MEIVVVEKNCGHKVELVLTNIYTQFPFCIMNIHVAPFACVSSIIDRVATTKEELVHKHFHFSIFVTSIFSSMKILRKENNQ